MTGHGQTGSVAWPRHSKNLCYYDCLIWHGDYREIQKISCSLILTLFYLYWAWQNWCRRTHQLDITLLYKVGPYLTFALFGLFIESDVLQGIYCITCLLLGLLIKSALLFCVAFFFCSNGFHHLYFAGRNGFRNTETVSSEMSSTEKNIWSDLHNDPGLNNTYSEYYIQYACLLHYRCGSSWIT